MFRSSYARRLAWAFACGWLLGMAIVLSRENTAQAASQTPATHYRVEPVYEPALHPLVVALLQGLGSVLAMLTLDRRDE